jgi:hypothetical protein
LLAAADPQWADHLQIQCGDGLRGSGFRGVGRGVHGGGDGVGEFGAGHGQPVQQVGWLGEIECAVPDGVDGAAPAAPAHGPAQGGVPLGQQLQQGVEVGLGHVVPAQMGPQAGAGAQHGFGAQGVGMRGAAPPVDRGGGAVFLVWGFVDQPGAVDPDRACHAGLLAGLGVRDEVAEPAVGARAGHGPQRAGQ